MFWRNRETWIVATVASLVAIYLAAVLNEVVPLLVAWYVGIALPIEVGIAFSLILLATGLAWRAESAKRSRGGYPPRKHVVYACADLVMAMLARLAAFVERCFSNGSGGNHECAPASGRPQRLHTPTRLVSRGLNKPADQEADLIERGLPEILARSGAANYASLTSACMADRLKNGYA